MSLPDHGRAVNGECDGRGLRRGGTEVNRSLAECGGGPGVVNRSSVCHSGSGLKRDGMVKAVWCGGVRDA